MANHKATKKSIRRDEVRRQANRSKVRTMKTFKTKFLESVQKFKAGSINKEQMDESFRMAQKLIARAGQKNLIPSGRASRFISRMNILKHKVETENRI